MVRRTKGEEVVLYASNRGPEAARRVALKLMSMKSVTFSSKWPHVRLKHGGKGVTLYFERIEEGGESRARLPGGI